MILAGLTGGMACGKSFVARTFAGLGAHVIEADELGHEVLQPGGEAYSEVVAEFGHGILDSEGNINRSILARRVFGDPPALARLNAIVHPAVRTRAVCRAEHIFESAPEAVVIYAAAILIESGGHDICQKIIVVSCTPEQQMERALGRSELTEADVAARIARQMPVQEKLKYADYVIDASGTKEDTVRQTKLVYEDLVRLSSTGTVSPGKPAAGKAI